MKAIDAIRTALSFGDHDIRHIEDMRNSPVTEPSRWRTLGISFMATVIPLLVSIASKFPNHTARIREAFPGERAGQP
jgi:hypothetical protein